MDAPRIKYAKTKDGVAIAYSVVGTGPPLLYLQPWSHLELEFPGRETRETVAILCQRRQIIRLDFRGTGLSQREADDYSIDAQVRDIEAVATKLRLATFDMYAYASAGIAATAYAARHPRKVRRFVLLRVIRPQETGIAPRVQASTAILKIDPDLWYETVAHTFAASEESVQETIAFLRATVTPEVQSATWDAVEHTEIQPLLGRIRCPTLVIHPMDDPLWPLAGARALAASIPRSTIRLLPGDRQDSKQLAPLIADFLDQPEAMATGTIEPPPSEARRDSPTVRTILFTDLADHTAMMQRLGDARGREVLREHERITRETLASHAGTEIKAMGDGFMASFGSAQKALDCAIALQRAFAASNPGVGAAREPPWGGAGLADRPTSRPADEPLRLHIGINAGEPIAEDDDLFGSSVILAARAASKAHAGQILVTNVVRQLVAGKGFAFAEAGEFEMKGFEDPVRLFEVRWESSADA